MSREEREREEIQRAFTETESARIGTGDFIHVSQAGGFQKALEVIERMRKTALPASEMYARDLERARKNGGKKPCLLCSGTGYSLTDNVAKICICRLLAMRNSRNQEQGITRPSDISSILFEDDDQA